MFFKQPHSHFLLPFISTKYELILFILFLLNSCVPSEIKDPPIYTGPLREVSNMEFFYSEDRIIKAKMKAAKVYEFLNDDREFPEGIYIEFFNAEGELESTLVANHAYYFKEQNQWRGRGNVVIKNVLKNEQLNTEELFWKPSEERIFTDKFVTIRQQADVIYGEGMEAKQDLSDFEIKRVTGDFELKENQ